MSVSKTDNHTLMKLTMNVLEESNRKMSKKIYSIADGNSYYRRKINQFKHNSELLCRSKTFNREAKETHFEARP